MKVIPFALLPFLASAVACGSRTDLEDDASSGAECPAAPCPSDATWDASQCACIPRSCPDDAGQTTIASLATDFAGGTAIAVRDGVVYWTTRAGHDDDEGSVSRVSRCGGEVTTLASGLTAPTALALSSENVLFGLMGAGPADPNSGLRKVPLSGGDVSVVASGSVFEGGIATDDDNIYWARQGPSMGAWTLPLGGGAPVPLVPGPPFGFVAVDADRVFLSQPASVPASSHIESVLKTGGDAKDVVLMGVGFPGVMVVDEKNVYYTTGDQDLMRVPKPGGDKTLLAHGEVNAMALDAADLYFAEGDATANVPGAIERVAKTGGAITTLITGSMQPRALAVDDRYVYWLNGADVVRLPK